MSGKHDRGVKENWEAVKDSLDEGYWDDVFREKVYYPDYDSPVECDTSEKGNPKGEFDVLAVNYDDQLAMYTEVKSKESCRDDARSQLERAREYFEDKEWDVIGKTYVASDQKKPLAAD